MNIGWLNHVNLQNLLFLSVFMFYQNHFKFLLAADLAEMLSVDMKKEGLCGRTLTLKLKTASFEVLFDAFHSNILLLCSKNPCITYCEI